MQDDDHQYDPLPGLDLPHVSSVSIERAGAHERVHVWLAGQYVGSLLVGDEQGQPLRWLLRSSAIVAQARLLTMQWGETGSVAGETIDDLVAAVWQVDKNDGESQ